MRMQGKSSQRKKAIPDKISTRKKRKEISFTGVAKNGKILW